MPEHDDTHIIDTTAKTAQAGVHPPRLHPRLRSSLTANSPQETQPSSPTDANQAQETPFDTEKAIRELEETREAIARGDFGDASTGGFDAARLEAYLSTTATEIGKLAGTPGADLTHTAFNPENVGKLVKLMAESGAIEARTRNLSARQKLDLQNAAVRLQKTLDITVEAEKAQLNVQIIQAKTSELEEDLKQKRIAGEVERHKLEVEIGVLEQGLQTIIAKETKERGALTQAQETALHQRRLSFQEKLATAKGTIALYELDIQTSQSALEKSAHEIVVARERSNHAAQHLQIELDNIFILADTRRRHEIARVGIDSELDIEIIRSNAKKDRALIEEQSRTETDAIRSQAEIIAARTHAETTINTANRTHKATKKTDSIADLESDRKIERIRIKNWRAHNGRRVKLGVGVALATITFSNFVDDSNAFKGTIPLTGLVNGAWDKVAQPVIDGIINVTCDLPVAPDCRPDVAR